MINEIFIAALAVSFGVIYLISFRNLPGEKWQMIAAVPVKKNLTGSWDGFNLTWYGFFTATGYIIAMTMFLILAKSIKVETFHILLFFALLLGVCVPASKLIAFIVEKKKKTFTVGGAAFVGMFFAPILIAVINITAGNYVLPLLPVIASLTTAYAYGEGFGRLACISFGCCYGKPVSETNNFFKIIFNRFNFQFHGKTKKVSYDGNLENVKLIPIQGITAVLYTSAAIAATYLFLQGYYQASFWVSVITTQLWRFLSEFLRADFRGAGKISAYQWMSLISLAYLAIVVLIFTTNSSPAADILSGLLYLWNPTVIFLLGIVWTAVFVYTGKSMVTESEIKFRLVK